MNPRLDSTTVVRFRRASRFFPQDHGNAVRLLCAPWNHSKAQEGVDLFFEHPHLGEIILGYDRDNAVCTCTVGFLISSREAGIIGIVDDVYVDPGLLNRGIEYLLLEWVASYLKTGGIKRMDVRDERGRVHNSRVL